MPHQMSKGDGAPKSKYKKNLSSSEVVQLLQEVNHKCVDYLESVVDKKKKKEVWDVFTLNAVSEQDYSDCRVFVLKKTILLFLKY